jgi:tetraacyldisaccharide 4'-kinase
MRANLEKNWYGKSSCLFLILLLPLSWLFGLITAMRRWLYRRHIFKSYRIKVPVIVVGNIVVGGTGKTPLVIWLATLLTSLGYRPGIISRGYGGKQNTKPTLVLQTADARDVGDEALLLAKLSGCHVVIGRDRVAAAHYLLAHTSCNVIISDDGLQHYRLQRDMEIVVVDGERRFGNQHLLPAGPLREPISRLSSVDFIVVNGGEKTDPFTMELVPGQFISVSTPGKTIPLLDFPRQPIHAVAAIGNPTRFFTALTELGFDVIPHPFPDHHFFQAADLQFADNYPIVMTEKDAVKCITFADDKSWYLPVEAKVSESLSFQVIKRLNK